MREHEAILEALRRRAGSELSDTLFLHLRNKRTAARRTSEGGIVSQHPSQPEAALGTRQKDSIPVDIFSAMTDFANAFLLVYAGLFPIINPVGERADLPRPYVLLHGKLNVNALARRVAINSILLLAGSMFIGSHLLVFFGITLPSRPHCGRPWS